MHKIFFIFLVLINSAYAQPVVKDVLRANRAKLFNHLIHKTIQENLRQPLDSATEEDWQDAFSAMELLQYRSVETDSFITQAMNNIQLQSLSFQRSLLELVYTLYPGEYSHHIRSLLLQTNDPKIFTMCVSLLLVEKDAPTLIPFLEFLVKEKATKDPDNPLYPQLLYRLDPANVNAALPSLSTFFNKNYLRGNVLMISIQRKNRNYPGLVLVRYKGGDFVKDTNGLVIGVPQIGRSISNLPGFLTNGNTPEGIYRMDGFGFSKTSFIGPTINVQLTMPFEKHPSHFFRDSLILDSLPKLERYKNLLPPNFRNYFPIYESYYAGKAGRREIIAHGTTVDPSYYKGKSFYPFTPMQGCLCTKEIWNESSGRRLESDQQKLTEAVIRAGGADGYCIVINIDDKKAPVSLEEILPLLEDALRN